MASGSSAANEQRPFFPHEFRQTLAFFPGRTFRRIWISKLGQHVREKRIRRSRRIRSLPIKRPIVNTFRAPPPSPQQTSSHFSSASRPNNSALVSGKCLMAPSTITEAPFRAKQAAPTSTSRTRADLTSRCVVGASTNRRTADVCSRNCPSSPRPAPHTSVNRPSLIANANSHPCKSPIATPFCDSPPCQSPIATPNCDPPPCHSPVAHRKRRLTSMSVTDPDLEQRLTSSSTALPSSPTPSSIFVNRCLTSETRSDTHAGPHPR